MSIRRSLEKVFEAKVATMGIRNGVMGPAQQRLLFEGGNVSLSTVNKRMKDLTTPTTTIIRTHGGGGWYTTIYTEPVPQTSQGDVWINTTCVAIRWKWIAFPAVMIGLTGLFLLLVAFENHGIETDRFWKSSFLAALFCEVNGHETQIGKKDMSAVAKSTSVSIDEKRGNLRLVSG